MSGEDNEKSIDDVLSSEQAAKVVGLAHRTMAKLIAIGAVDGIARSHAGSAGHRILRGAVLDWAARGMPRDPAGKQAKKEGER